MQGESWQGASGSGLGAAALLAAPSLLQIYDSEQDRKAAERNTKLTIAARKAEAELAYQRSVEMWNMQNLYNSPAAQMRRYAEAGLNPHLIYGQGTPGNAQGMPQYNPAQLEYKYQAAHIAPGLSGILPTLMSVGSWMQQMRMSEVEIQRKLTDTERLENVVSQMEAMFPQLFRSQEIKNQNLISQGALLSTQERAAFATMQDLRQAFRHKYGDELFKSQLDSNNLPGIGGIRRLEFLEQEASTRLKQAQASFTDFNITNPQHLMQMVLGGVMGLAGQQLRLSTHPGKSVQHPKRVKTYYDKGKRRSQVVDY